MKSVAEILSEATDRNMAHTSNGEASIHSNMKECMERIAERANKRKGELHIFDGYNCELCLNRGSFSKVNEYDGIYEQVMVLCSCMKIRESIRNLKRSGLEKVIDDFTLEKFKVEKPFQELMFNTAQRYLAHGNDKWLAFLGASGSGKTHLCSAVAIELIKRGNKVKYMLWKDDSRKIKNDNFDGDGTLIEAYKNVDVLYIDDLFKTGKSEGGLQKPTAGDINLAFEIINSRVAQKKITIISSESSIDDLFDIDEAVAGRIKQMCGEYCLNISKGEGKNYRKRDFV
jgi:DNA replication protein DnaC